MPANTTGTTGSSAQTTSEHWRLVNILRAQVIIQPVGRSGTRARTALQLAREQDQHDANRYDYDQADAEAETVAAEAATAVGDRNLVFFGQW